MKPAQPRVPVRWGFVLTMGLIVEPPVGAAAYYFFSDAVADQTSQKSAIGFVKRVLGH